MPTAHNIADVISRGTSVQNLLNHTEEWVHGPKWMFEPTGQWPKGSLGCIPTRFLNEDSALLAITTEKETLLDISAKSSFKDALAAYCRVFKAASWWLSRKKNPDLDCSPEAIKQRAYN